MKKFPLVFFSVFVIGTVAVFAYNTDKGPARQKDGITELPVPANDSLLQRGKELVYKLNYSKNDLEAISAYLNNKK